MGTGTLQNVGIFDGSNSIPQGGWSCLGPRFVGSKVADLSMYSGQTVWFRPTNRMVLHGLMKKVGTLMTLDLKWITSTKGNWISDAIQVDDLGAGFIDVDGMIAEDTS